VIDIEKERVAFETEFSTRGSLLRYGTGYANEIMDALWDGWLAAKRDAEKGE
jgi:hypothetical protein